MSDPCVPNRTRRGQKTQDFAACPPARHSPALPAIWAHDANLRAKPLGRPLRPRTGRRAGRARSAGAGESAPDSARRPPADPTGRLEDQPAPTQTRVRGAGWFLDRKPGAWPARVQPACQRRRTRTHRPPRRESPRRRHPVQNRRQVQRGGWLFRACERLATSSPACPRASCPCWPSRTFPPWPWPLTGFRSGRAAPWSHWRAPHPLAPRSGDR
jgi:hypothetical protein